MRNTIPQAIVAAGFTHEFTVRMDDRFGGFSMSPFLYLNPGAVTPISHARCTAMRFDLSERGVENIERFSIEAPEATCRTEGGEVRKAYAFVNDSIVTGELMGFKN